MLDRVCGRIVAFEEGAVILDCGGLGLRLHVLDAAAYARMKGKRVTLPVWLDVQPRRLTLYGFIASDERSKFLSLLQIPGIGPSMAMRLVPSWGQIERGDAVPEVPGLGPARRARVAAWLRKRKKAPPAGGTERELVQALCRLGLPAGEARVKAKLATARAPAGDLAKLLRLAVRKRAAG